MILSPAWARIIGRNHLIPRSRAAIFEGRLQIYGNDYRRAVRDCVHGIWSRRTCAGCVSEEAARVDQPGHGIGLLGAGDRSR
jgi:hypothetical protein